MSDVATSKLFQPITIGDLELQHRVVMAPVMRFRANSQHEMGPLNQEYYNQRAGCCSGTFIIAEATMIAPQAGGYKNAPGIWTDRQIASWKEIVDGVHARGSFIFLQLWDLGAAAEPSILLAEEDYPWVGAGKYPYVGAGDLLFPEHTEPPRPLSVDEIHEHTWLFANAARNAVEQAGFDGVEIHACNGYLLDQFLQTNTNNRTDEYGGSVENRIRFPLEVVDAVVAAVGAKKTAIRISPWSRFQAGMCMKNPKPTFSALVERLRDTHPDLAYLHIVEPGVHGTIAHHPRPGESNQFIREIWGERRLIAAGGFTRKSGMAAAEHTGELIAYGRAFIENPDLVRRFKKDLPLNLGDPSTYYGTGRAGYTDYPFAPAEPRPALPSHHAIWCSLWKMLKHSKTEPPLPSSAMRGAPMVRAH
ncbi:FMN-linked oxidoreductase [Artomyces pyxidatus]|uniref:FMN-linked oxidoreductase n=1 Tax=Artomyces pyxidatus TaxID=48021 RepID=A0ACB8TET7_9AGAM|nr:FMN-linked oxidoreductase [Artomyces pyxidatus]